jgi:acyl carrier protein
MESAILMAAAHSDYLGQLRAVLCEEFELDAAAVRPEALLYDDLDIDSIDAVDLLVRLKALTGKDIAAERFKEVRSIADVVAVLESS